MSEIADQIFNEIKHGDDSHKAWLLETLCNSPTLQALQRRVEWTKARPTKAGYYWWKDLDRPGNPHVVTVVADGYGLIVYGLDEYNRRLYEVNGEWAGPIPAPHEARG